MERSPGDVAVADGGWKEQLAHNLYTLCDGAERLFIIVSVTSSQRAYSDDVLRGLRYGAVVLLKAVYDALDLKEALNEGDEKTLHDLAVKCHERVVWFMMLLGAQANTPCCMCQADNLFVRGNVIRKFLGIMGDLSPLDNDDATSPPPTCEGLQDYPPLQTFIITVHAQVLAVLEALGHLLRDPFGEALRQRVSRAREVIQSLRPPTENRPPTYSGSDL